MADILVVPSKRNLFFEARKNREMGTLNGYIILTDSELLYNIKDILFKIIGTRNPSLKNRLFTLRAIRNAYLSSYSQKFTYCLQIQFTVSVSTKLLYKLDTNFVSMNL